MITEIGVTNQRLIVKRGWLARSTDEIALRSIEQVNFQQGFIGRLLGYGQVDVHGTGVDNLIIPPIADPLRFVKAIEDAKGGSKAVGLGLTPTFILANRKSVNAATTNPVSSASLATRP